MDAIMGLSKALRQIWQTGGGTLATGLSTMLATGEQAAADPTTSWVVALEQLPRLLAAAEKEAAQVVGGIPWRGPLTYVGTPATTATEAVLELGRKIKIARATLNPPYGEEAFEVIRAVVSKHELPNGRLVTVLFDPHEWERLDSDLLGEMRSVAQSRESAAPPAGGGDQAPEGFVLASAVWADRFSNYKKFRAWLDDHPKIRRRKPSPNARRLYINMADWTTHWAAHDKKASEALDCDPEALADVSLTGAAKFAADAKKRKDAIDRKRQRTPSAK